MSLKKNVIANYFGQGWTALMSIAFVPLYIKYMGIEAYGLIGIFALLQAWLTLMDLGITPTLNREMARFVGGAHSTESIRELLHSLEAIVFSMALIMAASIWFLSDWLGGHWLKAEKLPITEVTKAISVMGLVVSLRFIESMYRGALLGLQRQVWVNVTSSGLATIRSFGAVAILAWWSPSLEAFFYWQLVVSIIATGMVAIAVHMFVPRSRGRTRFSWVAVESVLRFASGMLATTLLSLLLMQVDKILLSRLLTLEAFGYYMLAATVANALYMLVTPVNQAFFPRFTELVTKGDVAGLAIVYHRGAQTISLAVIPSTLLLVFFGYDLLRLWTGNETLAHQAAPLLALLSLGTMLNALMNIPYQLTLAYGWVSFAVWMNVIAVLLLLPAIYWATLYFGAVGAAWIWVILNLSYLLFAIHFIHQKLLTREKRRWILNGVIFPMLAALVVGLGCWYLQPINDRSLIQILWIMSSGLAMLVATGLAIPYIRILIRNAIWTVLYRAR